MKVSFFSLNYKRETFKENFGAVQKYIILKIINNI